MKLKYKISLFIIGFLLVISTTICSSYSYWTLTEEQTDTNIVETGCLNLTLNDLKDGSSTSINLENTFPMDDTTGKTLTPYTVTLTNDCTITAKYNLLLVTDSANTLEDNFIDLYLTDTSNDISSTTLKLLPKTGDFDDAMLTDLTSQGITKKDAYELTNGILSPNDSVTYNLRLWVNNTATNTEMSKIFKAAVEIYYEATAPIE